MWRCSLCSFDNDTLKLICTACNKGEQPNNTGNWNCELCSFGNSVHADVCQMCMQKRKKCERGSKASSLVLTRGENVALARDEVVIVERGDGGYSSKMVSVTGSMSHLVGGTREYFNSLKEGDQVDCFSISAGKYRSGAVIKARKVPSYVQVHFDGDKLSTSDAIGDPDRIYPKGTKNKPIPKSVAHPLGVVTSPLATKNHQKTRSKTHAKTHPKTSLKNLSNKRRSKLCSEAKTKKIKNSSSLFDVSDFLDIDSDDEFSDVDADTSSGSEIMGPPLLRTPAAGISSHTRPQNHSPISMLGSRHESSSSSSSRSSPNSPNYFNDVTTRKKKANYLSRYDALRRSKLHKKVVEEIDSELTDAKLKEQAGEIQNLQLLVQKLKKQAQEAEGGQTNALAGERTVVVVTETGVEDVSLTDSATSDATTKLVKSAGFVTESQTCAQDVRMCGVCEENQRMIRFGPCGHFVCCQTCASVLTTCAVCRKAIKARDLTYLA